MDIEIYQQKLYKALARENRSIEIRNSFKALKSNHERVYFAYELAEKYNCFADFKEACKADTKSESSRLLGNKLFSTGKNYKAIYQYTISAAYAENKEKLSLAYANRSAVLFRLGRFSECIQDIERAFEHYPEHLRKKIETRKAEALKLIENGQDCKPFKYFKKQPVLSHDPNDKIEQVSSAVKIGRNSKYGYYVEAARDIKAGDVIAAESPYLTRLEDSKIYTHCSNCSYPCLTLVPCPKCPTALYCSEQCKLHAWDAYHQFECPISVTLTLLDIGEPALLGVRVAVTAIKELKNIETYEREGRNLDKLFKTANYEEIHHLYSGVNDRSASDLLQRSFYAAIVLKLLENHSNLSDIIGKFRDQFASTLLHHMQTCPANAHWIDELSKGSEPEFESRKIGSGVYAFLSLLNHSCAPNVTRNSHGATEVLTAILPIKKGEQLFDNYGAHFAVMNRSQRAQHLKQYLFTCDCIACTNNWPDYFGLKSRLRKELPLNSLQITLLQQGDEDLAKKFLPVFIKELNAYPTDTMMPCKYVCDLQESLKQCLCILANKNMFCIEDN